MVFFSLKMLLRFKGDSGDVGGICDFFVGEGVGVRDVIAPAAFLLHIILYLLEDMRLAEIVITVGSRGIATAVEVVSSRLLLMVVVLRMDEARVVHRQPSSDRSSFSHQGCDSSNWH